MKTLPCAALCAAFVLACSTVFAQVKDSPSDATPVTVQEEAAEAATQAVAPVPEAISEPQIISDQGLIVSNSGCATCNQGNITFASAPVTGECSTCSTGTTCDTCTTRTRVVRVIRERRNCELCSTGCSACDGGIAQVSYAAPMSSGCSTCGNVQPVSYAAPVSTGCASCGTAQASYSAPISSGCSTCGDVQQVSYAAPVSTGCSSCGTAVSYAAPVMDSGCSSCGTAVVAAPTCCETPVASDCQPQRTRIFANLGSRRNNCCR
jgi:hypothetical protein